MKTPYFVAELSGNHRGDPKRAEALMKIAADCGADAVKLQTYDPERLVAAGSRRLESGPWAGRDLIELYREAWTPPTWHKRLFNLGKELNVTVFSSPFSPEDVDLLEELGCPIYKIASFEICDLDLIRYAAETKKPMVISTGMARIGEIEDAVDGALKWGAKTVTIMACTSGYPTPSAECNLARIPDLVDYFAGTWEDRIMVGFSDHTLGISAPLAAIALGAVMVEKHLTDFRSSGGPDAAFSAEPGEFKSMVLNGCLVPSMVGRVHYGPTDSERPQLELRRGLWVVKHVPAGGEFTRENLRSCRPAGPHAQASGMLDIREFLGKKAAVPIAAGTPFKKEFV